MEQKYAVWDDLKALSELSPAVSRPLVRPLPHRARPPARARGLGPNPAQPAGFARTLAAAWGVALLDLQLRVQLNILGSHLYLSSALQSGLPPGQRRELSQARTPRARGGSPAARWRARGAGDGLSVRAVRTPRAASPRAGTNPTRAGFAARLPVAGQLPAHRRRRGAGAAR